MRPALRTAMLLAGLALVTSGPPARAEGAPRAAAPSASSGPQAHGATPDTLVPYRRTGEPYKRFFTEPPQFRGPGREEADPVGLTEVLIGVLAPLGGPDAEAGRRVLAGIDLAIDEANDQGGYRPGLPFKTVVRDENVAWGAAANTAVELSDLGAWALIGAVDDTNTHVVSRVALKLEMPIVNTAGVDPTVTEHAIPWIVRMRPDDRQNGYRLVQAIFEQDRHERVVLFRTNDRNGRVGTKELVDAARRLHHPVVLELRFLSSDTEWPLQLERIRAARPDAVVLWGRPDVAGRVLRALRDSGIDAAVYGPDRLVSPAFLEAAGAAAEGTVVTHPFDPSSAAPTWQAFAARYRARFGAEPDAFAAHAYDGTRLLVQSIREAGLNRARIRDRLMSHETWPGVTGPVRFDPTRNALGAVILGRVSEGRFAFD